MLSYVGYILVPSIHCVLFSDSYDFRGVVQCFPGKSAKDPVTFKTLEPQGCDSLWQKDIKKTVLNYTAGLGACQMYTFGSLPSPRLVGASTDELPLVTRFP